LIIGIATAKGDGQCLPTAYSTISKSPAPEHWTSTRRGSRQWWNKTGAVRRVIVGKTDLVERTWKLTFPVMIEFPTLELALRLYRSEEYRELKTLRLFTSRFNAIFMEGI
jgi:uncharacterized protein (DUF1330 family)